MAAQEDLAWFLIGGVRRSDEGECISRQTWEARKKQLGPEHRDTLNSMDTYATALVHQHKMDLAERLARECYETREHVLGPDDRDTLTSLNNLATIDQEIGRLAESEQLLRECLVRKRRVYPADHPDNLGTLNNLGLTLLLLGRLEEAERYLMEGLATARRVCGIDHTHTLHFQHVLARVLADQVRWAEAEQLLQETVEARRRVTPAHEGLGRALLYLGRTRVKQGNIAGAEPVLEEALALFRQHYAAKAELAAQAENWLGACRVAHQSFAEAEPILTSSCDVLLSKLSLSPEERELAVANVVNLYEAWGSRFPEQPSSGSRTSGQQLATTHTAIAPVGLPMSREAVCQPRGRSCLRPPARGAPADRRTPSRNRLHSRPRRATAVS